MWILPELISNETLLPFTRKERINWKMELPSSDSDGKKWKKWVPCIECIANYMRLNKSDFSSDSNMDVFASGTEDTSSNIDTDANVTAFDTDLPAAHNVSTILKIFRSQFLSVTHSQCLLVSHFSIWANWNEYRACNIWNQIEIMNYHLLFTALSFFRARHCPWYYRSTCFKRLISTTTD